MLCTAVLKSHQKTYKPFPRGSKSAQDFGKARSSVTQGLIQISIATAASVEGS